MGLLTIEVLEARGLKKYDILGKSDPFIELSTQPLTKEKTAVKKKTLTPHWNETKHVLVQVRPAVVLAGRWPPCSHLLAVCICRSVDMLRSMRHGVSVVTQEPSTQFLRVEMYDHDLFQPKVNEDVTPVPSQPCQPACSASAGAHFAAASAAATASRYLTTVCGLPMRFQAQGYTLQPCSFIRATGAAEPEHHQGRDGGGGQPDAHGPRHDQHQPLLRGPLRAV